MARILEHHAKQMFANAGIPVPEGYPAVSADQAATIAEGMNGPVVIKALVPVGKRGEAGAIQFAEDSRSASQAARDLIGRYISAYMIDTVLVEERIEIASELYISIIIDRDERRPRIVISASGGVSIEDIARERPEEIVSQTFSMSEGLPEFRARELWVAAGLTGPVIPLLGRLTNRLWNLFLQHDLRLIEINPLFVTPDDTVIAGDAVLSVDDSANFRHPELDRFTVPGTDRSWRPMTELETRAQRVHEKDPYRGSARYLELDGGNIGFLCGGGGASLLLYDHLVQAGGHPANYAEIGGNPTEAKVAGMTSVVLSKPGVEGLFVAHNITNNTQIDVIARGVVQGIRQAGRDPASFPVIAREAGLHDVEGKDIFEGAGVTYFGEETTLASAAQQMVDAIQEGGSR
ncbi:MAG: succinate--CoA ligase [Sphaerobacteraceae bacterium]|nr:MAG: succinate--CoA ligase [Sphaerobacteraceae bacterium]